MVRDKASYNHDAYHWQIKNSIQQSGLSNIGLSTNEDTKCLGWQIKVLVNTPGEPPISITSPNMLLKVTQMDVEALKAFLYPQARKGMLKEVDRRVNDGAVTG